MAICNNYLEELETYKAFVLGFVTLGFRRALMICLHRVLKISSFAQVIAFFATNFPRSSPTALNCARGWGLKSEIKTVMMEYHQV